MKRPTIAYIPSAHLDLFWLGSYKTCLERGTTIIQEYLDRCLTTPDETFLLETTVFAEEFLRKHPDYREKLVELVQAGRVEVGAAYIDRLETLVPAESLIRNVLIGKRWCREVLGIDNPTVTHPDLPSLVPQLPQIYHQLGVRYYVTSRKMYRDGRVWRFRAPDGSRLIMLNWPRHYVFPPIDPSDVTPEIFKHLWVAPLDMKETLKGFPLGVVAASGSAGDLTGRETFRERYGQNLEDFVAAFRVKYPQYDFTYTIPSQVLAAYDDYPDLAEHSGEAPSVWGIGGGEDHAFITRGRRLESNLLIAESLAALAGGLGVDWLPPEASGWGGTFDEDAFFARKDAIAPGQALLRLWEMQVFTQDHNAGGQEGVLSSFQRKAIQERGLAYTQAIIQAGLENIATRLPGEGPRLVVFNTHAQPWSGLLAVRTADEDLGVIGPQGQAVPSQAFRQPDGGVELVVDLPDLPPMGYRAFKVARRKASRAAASSPIEAAREDNVLRATAPGLEVSVDLASGAITLLDRENGEEWGGPGFGQLYSLTEAGNDVKLIENTDVEPVLERFLGAEVVDCGPLAARLRLRKEILNAAVEQTLTLWANAPRLDLETHILWWGKRNQQVRLGLSRPVDRADITHGSPFYGVGWTETMEGCGPWNSDEVSPEVQMSYREVLGWLHLRGQHGGLAIVSDHAWYHHAPGGLEAMLMRTVQSCGDSRLFYEQAGEHTYRFTLITGDPDWRKMRVQQQAWRIQKPPSYRLSQPLPNGAYPVGDILPEPYSLLRVEDERFALSSLYPGARPGTVIARIWETEGRSGKATFSGPLAQGRALAVDFMEENGQPLQGKPGAWSMDVPAWGIRSVLFEGGV